MNRGGIATTRPHDDVPEEISTRIRPGMDHEGTVREEVVDQ